MSASGTTHYKIIEQIKISWLFDLLFVLPEVFEFSPDALFALLSLHRYIVHHAGSDQYHLEQQTSAWWRQHGKTYQFAAEFVLVKEGDRTFR